MVTARATSLGSANIVPDLARHNPMRVPPRNESRHRQLGDYASADGC